MVVLRPVARRLSLPVAAAVLALCAAAGGSASPRATCLPTPPDGFGPFGRGVPPLRAKTGTGHVLTGRIVSALGCVPLRRAQVQFWQSDGRGRYTRALSATVLTARSGGFHYQSPRPVSYEGREPHIHIRVIARDHEPLLTRYVPRGTRRGHLRLVLVPSAL